MKKIILILIILIGMVGCEFCNDDEIEIGKIYDYDFENDIEIELMFDHTYEFTYRAIHGCIYFIDRNLTISSTSDIDNWGIKDYWQTPEQSYILKHIDCEDYIIFLMYLLEVKFDIRTRMIIIRYSGIDHALLLVDNQCYDPAQGIYNNTYDALLEAVEVLHIISYPEVIWMTVNYHDNVGKYE